MTAAKKRPQRGDETMRRLDQIRELFSQRRASVRRVARAEDWKLSELAAALADVDGLEKWVGGRLDTAAR
jgi:hypothetical protein